MSDTSVNSELKMERITGEWLKVHQAASWDDETILFPATGTTFQAILFLKDVPLPIHIIFLWVGSM